MSDKNIWWAWAIKNSVVILAFTTLSIVFSKWWIVLFSALFMSYPKFVHRYYRICDGCGKHSSYAESYNEALDKAKEDGWTHFKNDNGKEEDYCPECQKKSERF